MTYVGKTIGRIRIVDTLGSGGSGDVYVGFDERLKRQVAVKSLRGEKRFDAHARARLSREAEILSQLDHPNICRVYDYLEQDDCDFLVLELVSGRNLLDLDWSQTPRSMKIKFARQIAAALCAAHERQVIHRDLKPQNVMVTNEGDVKVLDFGLAHSATGVASSVADAQSPAGADDASPDVSDGEENWSSLSASSYSSFRTAVGKVTGTPMYMSPEQARGETMTAASDMYSFGLLMQWIFTGSHPHPKNTTAQRLIWLAVNADSLPIKGLQNDLTALINRLKSKSPELRPTAFEVVDRLAWIEAGPRRKRRRVELILVAIVLLATTVWAVVDNLRARQAERRAIVSEQAALTAQAETKAVNDFLEDMLASADPEQQGIQVKVVDVLDRASKSLDRTFVDQPTTKAAVLHTLAKTYRGIGEPKKAHAHAQAALHIRQRQLGETHVQTLLTQIIVADALFALGRYDEADARLRNCIEAFQSQEHSDCRDLLKAQLVLAQVCQFRGAYRESEDLFRDAWQRARKELGEDRKMTLKALTGLAWSVQHQSQFAEAEAYHRRALEGFRRELGHDHPDTLASMYGLAGALQYQGKLEPAEQLLRETLALSRKVFGKEHANTLAAMDFLATVLGDLEQYEEAESLLRQAWSIAKSDLGPNHPDVLGFMNNLGWLLTLQDKCREAEPLFQELVRSSKISFGSQHPHTYAAQANLAKAWTCLGRTWEAERLYRQTLHGVCGALGASHYLTLKTTYGLAKTLEGRDETEESVNLYRRAAKEGHQESLDALNRLGLPVTP